MKLLSYIFFLFTAGIAFAAPTPTTSFLAVRTANPVEFPRTFIPPTHGGGPPAAATQHHGPTATCTPTIVPDKNGYVPPGTCNANYNYYPSFGAAIAASIIFGILTIVQIGQAIYYRKGFCWVIIMGCLWELAAYGARVAGTKNQQSVTDLLIFQIFVLLAPLWVNAFCYMVLGRMIHFFTPTHKILGVQASYLSVVFVLLDIVSFIIQLYGTTMTSSTAPEAQILKGIHIYMGGIGLQQFFILVFLGLGVKFQFEMLRLERNRELPFEKQNWKKLLYTLYAALTFITVRIIFRLIEFSAGPGSNNPLPYHERYFYIFDAIPMALAILALSITHVGNVIYGPDSKFPKSAWRQRRAEKKNKGGSEYIEMLPNQEGYAGLRF